MPPQDAEDSTQAFFLHVLEDRPFHLLTTPSGSFRGYLKKALATFAIDRVRHERAKKRRPEKGLLSLDRLEEDLGGLLSSPGESPEVEFDRQWVRQIFRLARERMAARYRAQGREVAFEVFRRHVLDRAGAGQEGHKALAEELGLSASQVNNHVSRGKAAFKRTLQEVVADSVGDPESLAAELDSLRDRGKRIGDRE